jgi:hypothetical protein
LAPAKPLRSSHDPPRIPWSSLAQSAIVADPSKPSSYDALGDIYAGESQPDFARNFYDKALEIDPADAAATKAIAALDRAGDKAVASDGGAKQSAP